MKIISSTRGISVPAGRKRSPVRSGSTPARSPVRSGSKRQRVDSALPLAALAVPAAAGAVGGMLTSSAGGEELCVEETFFAPEDVAQIVADQVSQATGEDINVDVIEDGEVLAIIAVDESGAEVAKTEIENMPDNVVTAAPTPAEIESSAKSIGKGSAKRKAK
jgi:hypothetical protein